MAEDIETIHCNNCNLSNSLDQKFCTQCGFPIGGTEEAQREFRLKIASRKQLLKDSQKQIKNAKTIIYILAGLFFIVGLYQGLAVDSMPDLLINMVISVLYLVLAAWADKNPFGSIFIAFIIYITVHILNAFIDPATLFQGIILKVIFILAFIRGIRSAREAQLHMKELKKYKAIPIGSN